MIDDSTSIIPLLMLVEAGLQLPGVHHSRVSKLSSTVSYYLGDLAIFAVP
jgi:hypothetical protein